jgi:organic radical activating enzyme
MVYRIAEKFKSVQGEGLYCGTPMAFIRFVGCSVGKTICHHCDTDFEKEYGWLGGGTFTEDELITWIADYKHVCLTGGEPLDQFLKPLVARCTALAITSHVETSGTVIFDPMSHGLLNHICVSPKPGYLTMMIDRADEIKVIVPGLGNGDGWPTLPDALSWALRGHKVFLQPRNAKHDINALNLALCEKLVTENPSLRLSVQMHKVLRVR